MTLNVLNKPCSQSIAGRVSAQLDGEQNPKIQAPVLRGRFHESLEPDFFLRLQVSF